MHNWPGTTFSRIRTNRTCCTCGGGAIERTPSLPPTNDLRLHLSDRLVSMEEFQVSSLVCCRSCRTCSTPPFTPSTCQTPPVLAPPTELCIVMHTLEMPPQSGAHAPQSGRSVVGLVAESGASFADVVKNALEPQLAVTPDPRAPQVYHTHTYRLRIILQLVIHLCCRFMTTC